MSNVDAAPESLAALLSSELPLVDVEVELIVVSELLEVCATEVTPGPVENPGELSAPQPSARTAARTRGRMPFRA
ncbi:hypothetical protein [Nannocystis bainbridge]|uniref:Uncharacterized protein n=1 Tax=Nannocystis bainbridge TaxID=2995303 RepID=A0ABT5E725_9BACT|nr:hypothetical protein [Nannocystis bainbridge]MDC0720617.1 hypothetical protein [Nannocystis bainbridge]